jgi:rhamnosyltransferase
MVLYEKRMNESETFQSLGSSLSGAPEKIDMVMYDNSPVSMWRGNEDYQDSFRLRYISDTCNPGVSKAYNRGFEIAQELRKKWLMFLDQDTLFPEGALSKYGAAIERHGNSPLFAPILMCDGRIYSPCHHFLNVNFPLRSVRPGTISARGKGLLNSGMCIHVDAFEKIGGFDERIPLDFADHDFMKRYRKHFDSFVLLDIACAHGFSDKGAPDRSRALIRFRFYCLGARNSIKSYADALSLFAVAFVRASRLSARFRDPAFILLFFTTFFRN